MAYVNDILIHTVLNVQRDQSVLSIQPLLAFTSSVGEFLRALAVFEHFTVDMNLRVSDEIDVDVVLCRD